MNKQPRGQEGTALTDWQAEPKSEMIERVIAAVDTGRLEAVEHGGEEAPYARYCERALFPFLEQLKSEALEAERSYEDDFKYLIEQYGTTEEEARLRPRDGDLWNFLDPASRFGEEFEGEEGVRLWETAATLAEGLGEFAANYLDRMNPAATQLIWDARERAEEALRRAEARLEASSAGDK